MKSNRTPFTDLCKLIAVKKTYDDANHYETEDVPTEVLCSVSQGVGRTEFYEALKAGVRLSVAVEVNEFDYDGQTVLEHDGHRYSIERTYPTGYGTLELSCAEVTR